MSAVICLSVGDVAANIIGKRFGRHRLGGKSLEGMLGNFAVTFAVIYFIAPSPVVALAGALTGAIVECLPLPYINDNLSIPLAAGLVMTLSGRLLG
jgi:dolichol kinase